jgi:hypothetical protein
MNATQPVKSQLTNCMLKCNVPLMLFLLVWVSFINVVEAGDFSSHEKVTYLSDFEYLADSPPESDLGDDSVGIPYNLIENCGLARNILGVQVNTTYCLNCAFQRPATRAPPNAFI